MLAIISSYCGRGKLAEAKATFSPARKSCRQLLQVVCQATLRRCWRCSTMEDTSCRKGKECTSWPGPDDNNYRIKATMALIDICGNRVDLGLITRSWFICFQISPPMCRVQHRLGAFVAPDQAMLANTKLQMGIDPWGRLEIQHAPAEHGQTHDSSWNCSVDSIMSTWRALYCAFMHFIHAHSFDVLNEELLSSVI